MWFRKSRPGFRRVLLKISLSALVLFAAMVLSTLLINIGIVKGSEKYIYRSAADAPPKTTVLVLGSQIRAGSLSPVLRDRVSGGIELMEYGKGRKLLLSGDHGQRYYDEVNAMRLFVLANAPAIAEEDIFMDHAGFSTWDSMYRARDVFQVKDLLIVTQEFHINRAVFIARSLGLEAGGLALNQDRFKGRSLRYWKFREYFARVKAFFFTIIKPKPKYLGDPIPILGDGRQTWI